MAAMNTESEYRQRSGKLQPLTIGEALTFCADVLEGSEVFFGHGTDNPWDEAVQLVLDVADIPLDSGDGVLPHPLTPSAWHRVCELLDRRVNDHVPLPYLLGKAWFAGLQLRCDKRAIVPRSPIAELLEQEFYPWYAGPQPRRILDLCCGGGSIGLACAWHMPEVTVDLVDLDEQALSLARENAELLGLQGRTRILQSDLFQAVAGEQYDIIVTNPPYVDTVDLASMPKEYHHEPELALGSGDDGLYLTRQILAQAADFLTPEGLLVAEVGNSFVALEQAYPRVPFTWLEFARGGHGVFALTAGELKQYLHDK
jgi:ribosomal protein L3 glutamine methyltransferase